MFNALERYLHLEKHSIHKHLAGIQAISLTCCLMAIMGEPQAEAAQAPHQVISIPRHWTQSVPGLRLDCVRAHNEALLRLG